MTNQDIMKGAQGSDGRGTFKEVSPRYPHCCGGSGLFAREPEEAEENFKEQKKTSQGSG